MIGKDGSIAVKIKAKVGLLTIDEIVFAGANYGADTFTHYLKDNTSNEYWTMSPASTEIVDSSMKVLRLWLANSSELSSNGVYFYQNSIRPALVLRSDVEITGGNGIQSNPYIVS